MFKYRNQSVLLEIRLRGLVSTYISLVVIAIRYCPK